MGKKQYRILITGGAGFIGSNLVHKFINNDSVSHLRIIDNLSNGSYENIRQFENNPKFEFIVGDICDYDTCLSVTKDMDKVSHQAGLGSVPRSVLDPVKSIEVNAMGTVNLLQACHINNVERIVIACSSSTYGDSIELPKIEHRIGAPLSPYAASKFVVEIFSEVFKKVYNLNYIGLRYFNIFGPNQSTDNPYAAVIPVFCKAVKENKPVLINGDGETSRDFTYVENAVNANDLALFTENQESLNQIYNVACGDQITLNQLVKILGDISGKQFTVEYGPSRPGDVKHSKADISKIQNLLNYKVSVSFREGLEKTYFSIS